MIWPFKRQSENKPHRRNRRKSTNKRFFMAANKSNLTAGWSTASLSADTILNADLEKLRARSRVLAGNEPYFRNWLRIQRRNIVGSHGIRLQMRVPSKFNADGTSQMDDLANRVIEQGWKKWCKRENCTVNKRYDFVSVQRLVYSSVKRDGEIFVRKVKGFKGNDFMFSLQLIEADHLDIKMNTILKNSHYVRLGVEYNDWNEAVAYHFLERHPGDYLGESRFKSKRIRLTSDEVIHVFDPERVDQTRGFPEGVASMTRSNMLNGYQESELVASRTASAKMGFFKTPDGESYQGDDAESDDEGNETEIITEADPGTFEELPEGFDFVPYDPQHPTTAFGSFVKTILQGIASGLGISYPNMANDYEGVSFSSLRQANLNDRDGWKEEQQWLIEQLHMQIFEDWLLMALTTNQLAPLVASKFERYNNPSWRPRGWSWVDPGKESSANKMNLEMGSDSLTAIVSEQGRDIEEVFQERQKENMLAQKYNIDLNPVTSNKEEKDEAAED